MTAREQAKQSENPGDRVTLERSEAIDGELKALGYGEIKATPTKRRGRPPKSMQHSRRNYAAFD